MVCNETKLTAVLPILMTLTLSVKVGSVHVTAVPLPPVTSISLGQPSTLGASPSEINLEPHSVVFEMNCTYLGITTWA